jgi:peptidoglycan L-alanyl-D-glutamate endopeptidase CwlK
MEHHRLSARSLKALEGVHPKLVDVVKLALRYCEVDFMVIEGVRTPKRQKELYAQGRTAPGNIVTWTLKSNHFVNDRTGFGHAVDILPAPYDWSTKGPNGNPFDLVYKAMMRAADELDTPIRSGLDWDRDGKLREKGENDSPHFELWGA